MKFMGFLCGRAAVLAILLSGVVAANPPVSGTSAASAKAAGPANSAAPAVKKIYPRADPPVVTDPHHLKTLYGAPAKPRFELKDIDWPAKAGEASLCLWKDDAVAAGSIGTDDNEAYNLPAWLPLLKKYDLHSTWWLITGDIGGQGNSGTWEMWKNVFAQGHDVQSHSVCHLNTKDPKWTGKMDDEYGNSQKAVNENVPGARCLTLAFPGGQGQENNDPAIAAKYYIAGRGGAPFVNPANLINYSYVNATSGYTIDESKYQGTNLMDAFDKSPQNKYYRGWWVGFSHWLHTDKPDEMALWDAKLAKIAAKVKTGELWLGLFREVCQYGQERDTAKLTVKSVAADKIVISLTDDMDDTLFDFPLTVKVRLDPGWKTAKATQGGKEAGCKVVEHDGAKYALVQVVPDRGDAVVTAGAGEKK